MRGTRANLHERANFPTRFCGRLAADWYRTPQCRMAQRAGTAMFALHGSAALVLGYGIVLSAALAAVCARGAGPRALLLAPLGALGGLVAGALVGGLALAAAAALLSGSPSRGVAGLVMATALLSAGVATGRWLSPRLQGDRHKRGTTFANSGARRRAEAGAAIRFAGLAVTAADETKHFKLVGTTGTGKSTAIRSLLAAALARGDRAVFADPDGGYLARFHDPVRGDAILNPFDSRARAWDLFQELRTPYDFDQLARSLVGEGTGAEQSWRAYAQTLVAAVMRRAHANGVRDIGELYRLLTAAPLEELRALLDGSPAQPFLDAGNERMFGSGRAVATARLTALDYLRVQSAAAFSIRDWVEKGSGALFLPYQADQIAALRSIISTWMRIAIFQTMSQGERDHRLWFVIDELDAIGAIDGLKDALARLRKFGGRCVLGFQSIAQLSALYGPSDSQTIIENCGNTLILRCSASEQGGTARFASRLIGDREIVRDTVSRSQGGGILGGRQGSLSIGSQHVIEPAVLPSEIEQLADLRGFAKLASQPAWASVVLNPLA